jgi:GNAT superfamily N-acetyltransferase
VIEASPIAAGERRAAARMYADAFAQDPGWKAVGPNGARRRWNFVRRICGGEMWAAPRAGGEILVTRDDGAPSAAIVYYGPEARHSSPWLTVGQAPGSALGGPAPLARALAADVRLGAGHPDEPHLYVSLLAADPRHQRGGRGRALLQAALDEARRLGVPAYLDTANPANLPYYHSFGFVLTGETKLPRGAPLWYLQHA